MANERLTEAIVRDHFRNDPLFSSIRFEEQKSANKRIIDCLAKASKSLTGKPGRPEFIITFPSQSMEYLIVIECKANVKMHVSENRNKPKEFAVDGVLHYSNYLSEEFSVLSIGNIWKIIYTIANIVRVHLSKYKNVAVGMKCGVLENNEKSFINVFLDNFRFQAWGVFSYFSIIFKCF